MNYSYAANTNDNIDYLNQLGDLYGLNNAVNWVLTYRNFKECSGSGKESQHHYGDGGLLEHTCEVIQLMYVNCDALCLDIPTNHIFCAGLFHDVGKTHDYLPTHNDWTYTPHKKLIHHLSRSALVWNDFAAKYDYNDRDEVLHAILAHHGLKEWGSPVQPQTKLAWLLHLCDCMSARQEELKVS